MSQIVGVRQTAEDYLKRWSGNISAGTTYSKGNNATQCNIGFQTQYQQERWAAQANLSSNLAYNSGATTSTRNSLAITSYQTNPPPGFSSSDYGTTSGLSWSFGR
jgi:hypothetical protein